MHDLATLTIPKIRLRTWLRFGVVVLVLPAPLALLSARDLRVFSLLLTLLAVLFWAVGSWIAAARLLRALRRPDVAADIKEARGFAGKPIDSVCQQLRDEGRFVGGGDAAEAKPGGSAHFVYEWRSLLLQINASQGLVTRTQLVAFAATKSLTPAPSPARSTPRASRLRRSGSAHR